MKNGLQFVKSTAIVSNSSNANDINIFSTIFPRMSLHLKLFRLQYQMTNMAFNRNKSGLVCFHLRIVDSIFDLILNYLL